MTGVIPFTQQFTEESTYLLEKTFGFGEVDDINLDGAVKCVSHTEHEPLQLSVAVGVIAHPHVKHFGLPLSHLVEICTLKRSVKGYLGLAQFFGHFDCEPVEFFHVDILARASGL